MMGLWLFLMADGLKKTVAVVDFEDRSGAIFPHLGKGVADMLATALVKSGKFVVVERNELSKILEEQKLGLSGLVTPQSAPKVGMLLGVQAIVTGSVTEFATTEYKAHVGFIGVKTYNARVAVDIRLVDTTTGEIIMAETATGHSISPGLWTPKIGFGSAGFDKTAIGKATRQAINDAVKKITDAMEEVPWKGKVILVSGNKIYMKPGKDGGVKRGMKFVVYRAGEVIIDPDTGLPLGSEEEKIGKVEVVEVKEKFAKIRVIEGETPQKGDILKEK